MLVPFVPGYKTTTISLRFCSEEHYEVAKAALVANGYQEGNLNDFEFTDKKHYSVILDSSGTLLII